MPNFDGRGPCGGGPMTGRGRGFCLFSLTGQNKHSRVGGKGRGLNAAVALPGRFNLFRLFWSWLAGKRQKFSDKSFGIK